MDIEALGGQRLGDEGGTLMQSVAAAIERAAPGGGNNVGVTR
jgi:hypothetical protein